MTYKVIAIGILALLALSSVMNPKAFRFLSGVLAVVILTLVTGYFVLASYSPTPERTEQTVVARVLAKLSGLVRGKAGFEDAARSTSQRILEGFEDDLIDTGAVASLRDDKTLSPKQEQRRDRIIVVERRRVATTGIEREDQEEQVLSKILAIVDQYLKEFKITGVQPADLNLALLRFQPKLGNDGKREYTVVFDEAFNQHVHLRVRQLKIKGRLVATTYACLATGVALLLLFGALKLINSRKRVQPEKDLLRLSNVSMV